MDERKPHLFEVLDSGEVKAASRIVAIVPHRIKPDDNNYLAPWTYFDSFNLPIMVLGIKG